MLRLHYEGIAQGSFAVRNVLAQPGPLTAPPEERSDKTPSFRVIDFGRGQTWKGFLGDESREHVVAEQHRKWDALTLRERKQALGELQIEDYNF